MPLAVATTRLFPPSYLDIPTKTTPLSILDANVANFTTSAAIWYLEPCYLLTHSHFLKSLTKTLISFPQWCGRLTTSPHAPAPQPHQTRCGRIHLRYHNATDPGVSFTAATYDTPLSSLIPSPAERARGRVWDKTGVPSAMFMPTVGLAAPGRDGSDVGAPGMAVQVTRFECGGWAVAVGLTHCLADAHALVLFVKRWGFHSRSLFRSLESGRDSGAAEVPPAEVVPEIPIFDPSLLDSRIAGSMDASTPASDTFTVAQTLSIHRHDQWASRHGAPFNINIPAPFASDPSIPNTPAGKLLDWSSWDISKPCRYCILHFPRAAVEALGESVKRVGASKMDALTAHAWACIVRARAQCGVVRPGEEGEQTAYVTLGMRGEGRLGLGEGFMGSPLLHAAVSFASAGASSAAAAAADISSAGSSGSDGGSSSSNDTTTNAARAIRNALSTFTPEAISAYLDVLSHDTTPQRIWHAFCGSKSLLATSWVRAGLYEVDFVGYHGGSPADGESEDGRVRFAESVMPVLDGLLQISEAVGRGCGGGGGVAGSGQGRGTVWYEGGVDVTVMLEEKCMERLLEDPGLFG